MGFVKEFRDFAVKGNAVDMAVGLILGAAFGGVVTSLVNNIMMPPIGMVTGGVDFKDKKLALGKGLGEKEVFLEWGVFVNVLIAFLITAVALFIVVKMMNTLRKKEEAKPAPPAGPTKEETLLMEIRDAIRAMR